MNGATNVWPQLVAKASGIWFATALCVGFVLTQSNGFAFELQILPALAFGVPIGVSLGDHGMADRIAGRKT
jgi:hypothetical protein